MPWIDDLPAEIADSLSDEVKTNPTLIQYNSLEDALKGHIQTKSLVGSSIRIPGEDAGETDKQEFYNKLLNNAPNLMLKPDFAEPDQSNEFYRTIGKPEGSDKYVMPEGNTLDAGVEAEIREIAYNSNLTQAQFSNLAKEMDSRNTTAIENLQGQADTAMQELKGKWGMTFEDRIQTAQNQAKELYPTRDVATLTAADLQAMYTVSEQLTGKGAQAKTQTDGQPTGITPTEAREQAAEIMRKIHDPKSGLEHAEKMRLQYKRIDLLKKYVPEFAERG